MKKTLIALLAALLVLGALCVAASAETMPVCKQCGTNEHVYAKTIVPATCQDGGMIFYHCSNCDISAGKLPTEKLACKVEDWTWEKEPGCAWEGIRVGKCIYCKSWKKETIPASGEHRWGDVNVETAPTCQKTGLGWKECKNHCGATVTVTLDKIAHNYLKAGVQNWVETKKADCENAGLKQVVCTMCKGEPIAAEKIPALGHDWRGEDGTKDTWFTKKAPTCTDKGLRYQVCARCLKVKSEETPATGHTLTGIKTTKAATCNTKGQAEAYCTVCKKTIKYELPYVGHDWKYATVTKESRHWSIRTCSYCGKSQCWDALNNEWVTTVKGKSIQNTFTSKGEASKKEIKQATQAAKASASATKKNAKGVAIPKTNDNTSTLPYLMIGVAFIGLAVLAASKRKVND